MSENTIKTNAIVVRTAQSGENDRILTLLSPHLGKLTVIAKGIRSLKHKSRPCAMILSYSSFVLKRIKDGLYSLTSADLIESFHALSEDIESLSYGAYYADLCSMVVQNGVSAEEEVRLLLNTLYVLCSRRGFGEIIKVVYELKLMELCGIMPQFSPVCPCGKQGDFFSVSDGEMRCATHKDESSLPIDNYSLKLALYISESSLKDSLYLSYDIKSAYLLSKLTESFFSYHFGKLPDSLTYLRKNFKIC